MKPEDKPLLEFMARGRDRRPPARHHARRAGRAGGGAARRVRGDGQGPGIHRRRRANKLEIRPQSGDKIAEIIYGLISAPADVRDRMKIALQPKPEEILDQPPKPQ